MTNDEFKNCRNALNVHCSALLSRKEEEYASDTDRLANFKIAGELQCVTPARALTGFMAKQEVSIHMMVDDLSNGKTFTYDQWIEKIGDVRNYCDLLWAVINEYCKENA